jgi:ribosomal protein S18 acetylase RimI-like enzyme
MASIARPTDLDLYESLGFRVVAEQFDYHPPIDRPEASR